MPNVEYENLNVQPAELERELEYRLRNGECITTRIGKKRSSTASDRGKNHQHFLQFLYR